MSPYTKEIDIFIVFRSAVILILLLSALDSFAGVVRSIETDDKKMNRINLKMGQSTVLRFYGDRPKKVVIGNQNYYNVEFVEGTMDVTLQPLQPVPTNLFVYCQKKTYGFLITTTSHGQYDDLVNVFWRPPKTTVKVRGKIIVIDKKTTKELKKNLKVGNSLFASKFSVTTYKKKSLVLVDFNLRNVSSNDLSLSDINIYATRGGKKLEKQTFVVDGNNLLKTKETKVRLIVELKSKRGFSLNIKHKDSVGKIIINKRLLR